MRVYRGIALFIFISSCSSTITQDVGVNVDTTYPVMVVSTPTTTLAISVNIAPKIEIICEPIEVESDELIGFKFNVYGGNSKLEVLNIVSWLDSQRADDLFLYEGLPQLNEMKDFTYNVDNAFSRYEIEMLVMDSNGNFITDYCLWENG